MSNETEVELRGLEILYQEYGFEDAKELTRMIANVDLSSPDKLRAFAQWKKEDGSKKGLEKLATTNA